MDMQYLALEAELAKVGLSDKEAAVYLAALALGPSPVQPISRKSKVARATTYLVLDHLMKIGLVTKYEENKKTFFVAEQPIRLRNILEHKERDLTESKVKLDSLLPKLQAYMRSTDDKPLVRYYEGIDGLRAVRSEMTMYSKPGDCWYQLSPVDHMINVFGSDYSYTAQRRAKNIRSKAIITTKSKQLREELSEGIKKNVVERKFVDPKYYTSSSGLSIYRDRLVIGVFEGKVGGVVVESDSVATMMRELFEMAWEGLDN